MLFNSIEFLFFLPIVFLLYWLVLQRNLRLQNGFLLVASYFFYAWWDWRFLGLIAFSSLVDFLIGLRLGQTEKRTDRRLLLWGSILVNLGFLGVFKYYDFFADNFVEAFTFLGMSLDVARLNWILPIGISFYTFQTLSYTLDVYHKELEPTRDIIAFFAFVNFFPQLVAGPIERATSLLPQFYDKRNFNYASAADGMRQILWGFFKKVVIADNCAIYVTNIFGNYTEMSSETLLLGGIYLLFQIYCDFSGYSDIAIGTARLFGFNLTQNFNNPYFSLNTTDFWRRWHISLSTWFRDYVFTPLLVKYRHLKKKAAYVATFITFFLLGVWHGANWTFAVFGVLQSIALCLEIYTKKWRKQFKKSTNFNPFIYNGVSWLMTITFWYFASILFRASSVQNFGDYIIQMFSNFSWEIPQYFDLPIIGISILLLLIEYCQINKQHGLQIGEVISSKRVRWGIYFTLVILILVLGGPQQEFVYFQF